MALDIYISEATFFLVSKIVATVIVFISLIAWIGNGLIITVTIKYENLRSACNILIAIQALSDIIIQMSHIPYLYFAYSETLVSYYTCYYINLVFFPCMDFSTVLVFCIALDRLISARFPVPYRNVMTNYFYTYIGSILSLCFTYSVTMKVLLYTTLTEDFTLCLIADSMTGSMAQIWLLCSSAWNLGVIVVYVFVARTVKRSAVEYQKVNQSLQTMILVYIFGWLFTFVGCSVAAVISPNVQVLETLQTIVGIAANVNLAAPFFIYYFRSTLYRNAFHRLMGINLYKTGPMTVSFSGR
ncbi:hypothetical protein L596_020365 [Steinernema carpocapsae]|uniref:G-protein coupled receptors family 1 profile domain-containing protein n=1 Tax=Steinernema carpocapsae TaxID=34508 RepID=A0A4U5MTB2_STECR|nr:hypothetical protein L596_020365 [Steinernema carpocapsae]